MRVLDWVVLAVTLAYIVGYGLYRARGKGGTEKYLLANRSLPWYAMALSIMATQASAITFICGIDSGTMENRNRRNRDQHHHERKGQSNTGRSAFRLRTPDR